MNIRVGDAITRLRASGATVTVGPLMLVAAMGRGAKPLVRSFAYMDRGGLYVSLALIELACDKFRAKRRAHKGIKAR